MQDDSRIYEEAYNRYPQSYRYGVPPSLINVTKLVYILHAASILIGIFTGASIAMAFVFGWPSIIAVVINYVKRDDVRGTYLDSHFSWQIRTFWWALAWIILVWIVGLILSIVLVGFAIWFAGFLMLGIWVCYRILRGWMRLSNGQSMPM